MEKVIYTAIMGVYDDLKDPQVVTPGWEYICYTNRKDLKSDVWRIIYMNFQTTKQVRRIKIITPFDYKLCIWVDGSIEVACDLNEFVKQYHREEFTLMKHPHRGCVYEEALACIQRKKDHQQIIKEQMDIYRRQRYPINNGMVATGLLIRENSDRVKGFCEAWWREVDRYSKRDQLSFNYNLRQHPIRVNLISYDVLSKEFILYLHNNKIIP